jgi:hypothetical protein
MNNTNNQTIDNNNIMQKITVFPDAQPTTGKKNKLFDGVHLNTMYSYEKKRTVIMCYVYNSDTGKGFYTSVVWRQPTDVKNAHWSKQSHRNTAIARFNKYNPVPFELAFDKDIKVFFKNVKKTIRRTMITHGTHGTPRTPINTVSANTEISEIVNNVQPATNSILKQSNSFENIFSELKPAISNRI